MNTQISATVKEELNHCPCHPQPSLHHTTTPRLAAEISLDVGRQPSDYDMEQGVKELRCEIGYMDAGIVDVTEITKDICAGTESEVRPLRPLLQRAAETGPPSRG